MKYLLFLTCVCITLAESPLFANETTSAADSLAAAHLQEAHHWTLESAPAETDDALSSFRAEMTERMATWKQQTEGDLSNERLLQGIPDDIWTGVHAAAADTAATQALLRADSSLPILLACAAERSPRVKAAQDDWRAALRRFDQAAYLEETVTQFRAFARELDTKVGPQTHKEMPGKTFAFPSILALKGEIIDLEVTIASLRYWQTLRQTINEIARTYFDIQYAEEAAKILRENRALFATMESLAGERLRVGQVSQADSLKAQAELAMVDTQLVTMERQRANAIARVNAMLQLPPDSPWGPTPTIDLVDTTVAVESILTAVRVDSQEVIAAKREAELMLAMIRMAETDILPRASLGYSQLAPSMGAEAGPTRGMMSAFPEAMEVGPAKASFGVDLAYLDELRIRWRQAQEMERAAVVEAEGAALDAHFRADTARRERQTLAESVIPKTRHGLETLRENYNTAGVPFIEYLDAARSYLQFTLAFQKTRMEHNQMLIELQDRIGQTVTRLLVE